MSELRQFGSAPNLAERLDIQPDSSLCLLNAPGGFEASLGDLPPRVLVMTSLDRQYDQVHYFCAECWNLEQTFSLLKTKVLPGGSLWVWWQHAGADARSDVDEPSVRRIGISGGLTAEETLTGDTWAAVKLVYPPGCR